MALSTHAINDLLEELDSYILAVAHKKVPHNAGPPDMLLLLIDELAQNVRIKYWMAALKQDIKNPKAYLYRIFCTEVVNMVRQYHLILPLPLDEEGELFDGDLVGAESEGMHNPAEEVEQEEMVTHYVTKTVNAALTFPPCQKRAIICSLKDKLDNLLPLIDALRGQDIDIETVHWPANKAELRSLKCSLAITHKKLRVLVERY